MDQKISLIWTIVFGLVIGVGANLLTPLMARLTAKVSSSGRERLRLREKQFAEWVQHLIDHPLDEVNVRIEKNGLYTRTLIYVVAACVIATSSEPPNVPSVLLVLLSLFGAVYSFVVGHRYARLAGAAWDQRKKNYPNVKSLD